MKRFQYIWQSSSWPKFYWDSEVLLPWVSQARVVQGKLLRKMATLNFKLTQDASFQILTEETLNTSKIEGENLSRDAVRSSVARQLGLPTAGLPPSKRNIDGLVSVLLEATRGHGQVLTASRLKGWQAALFPSGYSGFHKIRAGQWRDDAEMQIVSGPLGKEKVHYEAPPGKSVAQEMKRFFAWWKVSLSQEEGLLRAALAHFYFVTIHPFEDGNGRIARALTDMALAQDEKLSLRYYSLSSQIMAERDDYYASLEHCQKGDGDVTVWLQWFLSCYVRAVSGAESLASNVFAKARFWEKHSSTELNDRQRKVINRLLDAGDDFQGGLTTRKYVAMTKASRVTAYREILDLVAKSVLVQNPGQGRSVSYRLKSD